MLLSKLLAAYSSIAEIDDREITHLCLSSLEVKPGALFFAYPGEKTDGRNYINDAIEKGAAAIVAEENHWPLVGATGGRPSQGSAPNSTWATTGGSPLPPTIIYLNNLQEKIGPIAQLFYDYPAKDMQIIGVTGTNGKTSIAYILAQIFNLWGMAAVSIGTLGIGKPGEKFIETGINTPDPISLQKYFLNLKQQNCKIVVMEVSSHGLMQDRVRGICFDAVIFTNLTQDHLDYHKTMEAYGQAKERILIYHDVKNAIFNLDDPWCANLYQKYNNTKIGCKIKCVAYSIVTSKIRLEETQLIGQFNLQNLSAAVTCLLALGYDEKKVMSILPEIKPVPGRLELVRKIDAPCCVIDYAHTPDALKKALLAVREFATGKIYCVFGCGGDRDAGKRPLMASIAEEYADEICVTEDNPRTESSEKILQDIVKGFLEAAKFVVIADRESAIRATILRAQKNDVVLIAGKGHEEYQIIGNVKKHFSDKEVVEEIFASFVKGSSQTK